MCKVGYVRYRKRDNNMTFNLKTHKVALKIFQGGPKYEILYFKKCLAKDLSLGFMCPLLLGGCITGCA